MKTKQEEEILKHLADCLKRLQRLNELEQRAIALMAEFNKINESVKALKEETTCRPITTDDLMSLLHMAQRSTQIILELEELSRKVKEVK